MLRESDNELYAEKNVSTWIICTLNHLPFCEETIMSILHNIW
jgi:hypothetical protein